VQPLFARAGFHEFALRLPKPASDVIEALARRNIVAGVALGEDYPELDDALLVCATETKTRADLDLFAAQMADALR
jgi:glycine dehydrogenase subunit 1